MLLGTQCLFIDTFVVKEIRWYPQATQVNRPAAPVNLPYTQAAFSSAANNAASQPSLRLIRSRDWMPWSLLAAGAVVVIYTFSLPGRAVPPRTETAT